MTEFRVKAIEVQVGDIVVGLSEVDYRVKRIRRSHCTNPDTPEVNETGGWVSLAGDSDEGYFRKLYNEDEDYYAFADEMITVQRDA